MSSQPFLSIALGALATWGAWARMKYPSTTPPWATTATLAALWVLLGASIVSCLDLLGFRWFRDDPLWLVGAAICITVLAWLWSDGQHSLSPPDREALQWPDFEKWDARKEFDLGDAACLWFDHEPRLPLPALAHERFHEWKATIERGDMKARFTYDPLDDAITMAMMKHGGIPAKGQDFAPTEVTVQTRVSRKVLKAWALDHGEQPRFLFSERRSD
jgi:hypothetical protein